MPPRPPAPLRLTVDLDALAANYRWFAAQSAPASCGAAVKADGYGIGARAVVERLAREGCRDFFVATWCEAAELLPLAVGLRLHVLHGLLPGDMPTALASDALPVLNTPEQVALWRAAAPERACDVMVDTGMNRLGLSAAAIGSGLLDGLTIDTLHSHLACADEPDSPANPRQLAAFRLVADRLPARRRALANSAGICLGADYHFDLTRPGLGLYGGIPHPAADGHVRPVMHAEAQVLQLRDLTPGDSVGYNGTFVASATMRLAVLNLGYADGYLRAFSNRGQAFVDGRPCPVIGRVSMDLTVVDVTALPTIAIGDWVEIDLDLPRASAGSGLSQDELLTCLGPPYQRRDQ